MDAAEVADAAGISTLSALDQMVTDPGLAREVFAAGFEPLDALFWAFAAWAAFRMTRTAVRALTAPAATAPAAEPVAPGGAAPVTDPTAAFSGQQAPWSGPEPTSQEPTS